MAAGLKIPMIALPVTRNLLTFAAQATIIMMRVPELGTADPDGEFIANLSLSVTAGSARPSGRGPTGLPVAHYDRRFNQYTTTYP